MPKRQPLIVGKLNFKTKKELHEYTKKLIEKKSVCEISNLDNDYDFFLSLYSRKPSHKDYVESIRKFKINLNPIDNKPNHLSCIDKNGKEFIFSWRKCCDGSDTKNEDKLIDACRTSIKEQTMNFWSNSYECVECGKLKNNEKFEVDHIIEFSNIYKNFITECNEKNIQIPNDFDSHPVTSQYMFKKSDNIFMQEFQSYHREKSMLQLLCYDCHKNKTIFYLTKK
jgi:5-methylcytosine-specific restriction endonuclease McrA